MEFELFRNRSIVTIADQYRIIFDQNGIVSTLDEFVSLYMATDNTKIGFKFYHREASFSYPLIRTEGSNPMIFAEDMLRMYHPVNHIGQYVVRYDRGSNLYYIDLGSNQL